MPLTSGAAPRFPSPKKAAWLAATFLLTFISAWPMVTGSLEIRFPMAIVVLAAVYRGREQVLGGVLAILLAFFIFGSSAENSIGQGHRGALLTWAVLIAIETIGIFVLVQRTIGNAVAKPPAARMVQFLTGIVALASAGAWLETFLISMIDDSIEVTTIGQGIGISVAAVIAAIFVSRRGSQWFVYAQASTLEMLAPMVIVLMTLVTIEVTRQVWERQDRDQLTLIAEASQNGFLTSTAEQLAMLTSGIKSKDAVLAVVAQQSSVTASALVTVSSVGELIEISNLAVRNKNNDDEINNDSVSGDLEISMTQVIRALSFTTIVERKVNADQNSYSNFVGINDIVSTRTGTEPHLTFAVDVSAIPAVGITVESGIRQFVIVAYSMPEILRMGLAALPGLIEDVSITVSQIVGESETRLWTQGEEIDQMSRVSSRDAVIRSSSDEINSDALLRFSVAPATGFGVQRSTILMILGIEILFGLLLLAVLLQVANGHYQLFWERRRRESLLEAALDATPGKSVVFDESLRVLAANREVRDEFPGSIPGLDVTEIFGLKADSGRARLVIDALLQALAGEVAHAELGEDDPDSSMRIVEIEAYPISGLANDRVGFLHATDSTERRGLAMRSAQSERMESLGALAGGLAHDFNNLLFVTLGNLQLMAMNETISSDEKLSKFVSRSMSAVERGAEITKSLLAVARSQPLEESAVTLSELVKSLLPLVRQALGAGRQVEVDIPDPTVQLMVDAGRLSSCILNLTFNSRDAMGANGILRISARTIEATKMIELSVADDGKGMPAEVVERAFEPFFTTKRAGSGTGLGLATVYAFAKQTGGTAYLESRLGFGTTVTLSLPIHTGDAITNDSVAKRRSGRRVVVADDEQSLAEMVSSWLIDMGVDARFATSPKAALELIEIFEPDVLVSDANFGEEVDGIQLARLAVAIVPDLAVIFMTGYSASMKDLQEQGERTLAKPFSREDLYATISPFIAEQTEGENE